MPGSKSPINRSTRRLTIFPRMTAADGTVGYSGNNEAGGESVARSSITNLVLAIAKRRDLQAYQTTTKYLTLQGDTASSWPNMPATTRRRRCSNPTLKGGRRGTNN